MSTVQPPFPLTLDPSARCGTAEISRLRAHGLVVRVHLPGGVPVTAVTDHSLLRRILHGPGVSRDARRHWSLWPEVTGRPTWAWATGWCGVAALAQSTEQDHQWLRTMSSPRLNPFLRLSSPKPQILQSARRLIHSIAERPASEPVDLRAAYARPLAVEVMCHLVAIPSAQWTRLREPAHTLTQPHPSTQDVEEALEQIDAVMVSAAVGTRGSRGQQNAELAHLLRRQFFASCVETTTHLITESLHHALARPSPATVHSGDDTLGLIDSSFRWIPSSSHVPLRFTTQPLAVGETTVPAGTALLTSLDPLNSVGGHGGWDTGDRLAKVVAGLALRTLLRHIPDLFLSPTDTRLPPFARPAQLARLDEILTPPDLAPGERLAPHEHTALLRYATSARGRGHTIRRIAKDTRRSPTAVATLLRRAQKAPATRGTQTGKQS